MTQLRFIPTTFAASATLFAALLAPLPAHALLAEPGCTADSECGKGFECTVVGTSGCGATPPCAPSGACPEPQPCETVVEKACTPAHCEADADCAAGMVCFDFPSTNCATTDCACPPDSADCECAAVPACDPQPNKMCAPRYVLPCKAAADCGEGFTCEEQLSCGCSGSSGSDPGAPQPGAAPRPEGAGAAPADAAPADDCSCQPTGEMRCMPKDITCTVPADCPMGWTCMTENVDIAEPAPACTDADCGSGAAAPYPAPRSVCQPDYYSGGVSGGDEPGTPTKGGDGSDNGGVIPPQAESSGGEENESSACQMGHAPASRSVLSLMVVLGAALGLKRRRR